MVNDFLLPRFTSRHADTSGSAFGVHPGGGMAALGSTEGIRVIDLNWPWEVNRVLQQPNTGGCAVLQWHPQPSRSTIASAGRHGSLGLYDLGAQSSARALVASLQNIDQVAVDALSWNLAAANELAIRTSDGTVALWDVRSTVLQPISSLMRWDSSVPPPAEPTGALCWSPHRPERLAATEGGVVQVWDVRRPGVPLASFRAHADRVFCLEWVGGGVGDLLLSCGDGAASLAIWRVDAGSRAGAAAPPFPTVAGAPRDASRGGRGDAAAGHAACVCSVLHETSVICFASCARPAALEAAEFVSAAEARQGVHVVVVANSREESMHGRGGGGGGGEAEAATVVTRELQLWRGSTTEASAYRGRTLPGPSCRRTSQWAPAR